MSELEQKIHTIIEEEFDIGTIYPLGHANHVVERIMDLLAEKVEPATEDKDLGKMAWSHSDSCWETHPGRTHKQWQTQAEALKKGFKESRGG